MARPYGYASAADVLRHLTQFPSGFTATGRPNASQVDQHLLAVADELDAALGRADYTTPISTAATVALNVLRHWTSIGAAMHVAAGMPQGQDSKHLEFLERRFTVILNGIDAGNLSLPGDAGRDTELALPRYPAAGPSGASPFFARDQLGDV
jgi:hypothetical protein